MSSLARTLAVVTLGVACWFSSPPGAQALRCVVTTSMNAPQHVWAQPTRAVRHHGNGTNVCSRHRLQQLCIGTVLCRNICADELACSSAHLARWTRSTDEYRVEDERRHDDAFRRDASVSSAMLTARRTGDSMRTTREASGRGDTRSTSGTSRTSSDVVKLCRRADMTPGGRAGADRQAQENFTQTRDGEVSARSVHGAEGGADVGASGCIGDTAAAASSQGDPACTMPPTACTCERSHLLMYCYICKKHGQLRNPSYEFA